MTKSTSFKAAKPQGRSEAGSSKGAVAGRCAAGDGDALNTGFSEPQDKSPDGEKRPDADEQPLDCKVSPEQLWRLNEAMLQRLGPLGNLLASLGISRPEAGLLMGKERTALISQCRSCANETELQAQVLACRMMLNFQCPGWEADDPELARLIAMRLSDDRAWLDFPIETQSCH